MLDQDKFKSEAQSRVKHMVSCGEMRQWYPRDKQKGQEDREESSEMVTLIEEGGTLAKIVAACSGPSLIVKGHKRHRN